MNTNIIEGNPTKKFFIEMITRDISIEDAIIDLLDNSIDGATQINPNDLSGFVINIEIDANKLSNAIHSAGNAVMITLVNIGETYVINNPLITYTPYCFECPFF